MFVSQIYLLEVLCVMVMSLLFRGDFQALGAAQAFFFLSGDLFTCTTPTEDGIFQQPSSAKAGNPYKLHCKSQ